MSDLKRPDKERPPTPEERSFTNVSANPVDSTPKFDVDAAAWITLPNKGACQVTIGARRKVDGKFQYQIQGADGVLYKGGAWFPQEKLSYA